MPFDPETGNILHLSRIAMCITFVFNNKTRSMEILCVVKKTLSKIHANSYNLPGSLNKNWFFQALLQRY